MPRKPVLMEKRMIEGVEVVGKTCCKCKEWKTEAEYNKDSNRISGYSARCKVCERANRATYVEANKSAELEKNRQYFQRNKEELILKQREKRREDTTKHNAYKQIRRARKRALPDDITADQMRITLSHFGGCALTGISDNIEWDHVIPIASGEGGTTARNMIPLRADLNASKRDGNIFTWFERNGERFGLPQDRFAETIAYISKLNGMSPEEYKEYYDSIVS